jgi:hypothetical protein
MTSSRPGPRNTTGGASGAFLVFTELKLKISVKTVADTLYYDPSAERLLPNQFNFFLAIHNSLLSS